MRGWIVLYCFSWGWILPKHYKTEKMAQKFAAEHRALGCEAVVIPANYPEFPDSCRMSRIWSPGLTRASMNWRGCSSYNPRDPAL